MNKKTFEQLSRTRAREAKALLTAGQYCGAYYLMGYAVECALKACFCKQIKKFDFPDKNLIRDAWTHKLDQLLKLTGLAPEFELERTSNENLKLNWIVVSDWSEDSRYEIGITESEAQNLYQACIGRNGILTWLMKRW